MRIHHILVVSFSLFVPVISEEELVISKIVKGKNGYSPNISVCFDSPIKSARNSETFNLEFSVTRHNDSRTTITKNSRSSELCQIFDLDLSSLEGSIAFNVTLYTYDENSSDYVLARGYAKVTMVEPFDFSAILVVKEEEYKTEQFIRIQHDYPSKHRGKLKARLSGFNVNDTFDCKVSPCYMIHQKVNVGDKVELCVSNVAWRDTRDCEVCETVSIEQGSAERKSEIWLPDVIAVTYNITGKPYISVTGQLDEMMSNIELVFYRFGENKCNLVITSCTYLSDLNKSCTGKTTHDLQGQYDVLLVALNPNGTVTRSTTIFFENYETKINQLTSDLIEVEWTSSDESVFEITLDKDVPGWYQNTTMYCGGALSSLCSSYFIKLKPKIYQVTVKKRTLLGHRPLITVTGSINIEKEKQQHLKVFSVALDASESEHGTTNITVCIEDSVESNKYEAVLIDCRGNTLRTSGALRGSDILCFTNIVLHSYFDTTRTVRVLVKSKFMFHLFVGDSELYLLDPNQQTQKKILKVDQVGERMLRTKWLNLNDAHMHIGTIAREASDIIIPSSVVTKCTYKSECGKFTHHISQNVLLQITEFGETMQTIHMTKQLKKISSFKIVSHFIEWERRLQVCFTRIKGAATYGLSISIDSTLWEDITFKTSEEEKICLKNTRSIEVGSLKVLEAFVTAYDDQGMIIASAMDKIKINFATSNHYIQCALMTNGIMISWQSLKELNGIQDFNVTFKEFSKKETNNLADVEFTEPNFSLVLKIPDKGHYAVCLRPATEVPKSFAGKLCTDIIHIGSSFEPVIPWIISLQLRSTSRESVFLNWLSSNSSEVSGFVVTWQLAVYGSYSTSSKISYRFPPELSGNEQFQIIPATASTYSLNDLVEESTYLICVAAVRDNIMGEKLCNIIDLSSYYSLLYPKEATFIDGIFQWNGENEDQCFVQWTSVIDGTEGFAEVTGNSYDISLRPGIWTLSVRNITDDVASGASKIHISVEGIMISYQQIDQSTLMITWHENKEIAVMAAFSPIVSYQITVISQNDNGLVQKYPIQNCSGKKGHCSFQISNIDHFISGDLSVRIKNLESNISTTITPQMEFIGKIEGLSMKIKDSGKGWVAWHKLHGVKRYKYILHLNSSQQDIRLSGFQPDNSLNLELTDLVGNVLTVQGCTDENHCGEAASVTLEETFENKVIIIFASAGIGLLVVILLIQLLFKRRCSSHSQQKPKQEIQEHRGYFNKGFVDN